jgi:hypothetical protein
MSRLTFAALLCVAVCVAALALAPSSAHAITTKVSAGEQFCVVEKVDKDVPLSFRFRVTAGGKLDIDAEIFDGNGQSIYTWTLATQGSYNLRGDATNTQFKFCFSNQMARWTPKWVTFFVNKGVHPAVAPRERVDPIETQILKLSGKMNEMRDAHDSLKVSEHDHRNTIEDVNERVLLWNVIQTIVLVVMGVVQVFFIKRFLEVRSSV